MIAPEIPDNEHERLKELHSFSILDTISEEEFDNMTRIASEICQTPISLISLIDENRQWFKSHHGLATTETPKEYAFCAHAINNPKDILMVSDSRKDERFKDNPLVTGDPYVIFYAGVPLLTESGMALGTLCVIDNKPHTLNQKQLDSLKALSKQVMRLLELRKAYSLIDEQQKLLKQKNKNLEQFAMRAAHDISSPLGSIEAYSDLLGSMYDEDLPEEGKKILSYISKSSNKLRTLVNGLLEYSKNSDLIDQSKTDIKVNDLISDLRDISNSTPKPSIRLDTDLSTIKVNRVAVSHILLNLTSNAIKYNDKDSADIEIGITEDLLNYKFYVKDNGPGIPSEYHSKVYDLFNILHQTDRFGARGNGIGLATVKELVTSLGGEISIESDANKGTKFIFTIKK